MLLLVLFGSFVRGVIGIIVITMWLLLILFGSFVGVLLVPQLILHLLLQHIVGH